MKFRIGYLLVLLAVASACGPAEENKETTTGVCGNGEEVVSGDDRACVYRSELIEEGFQCPADLEHGFLLDGGGVACTPEPNMPGGLGEALRERGHEPKESGCFDDFDPGPECFHGKEPVTTGGLFDAANADTILYRTGPGYAYIVPEGELVRFELDTTTLDVVAGVAELGDAATDNCLDEFAEECIVSREVAFTITQDDLDALVALLDAVPAPMCEVDPSLECDPHLIEVLEVDDVAEAEDCCGEHKAEGFSDAFHAVVDAMLALVPAPPAGLVDNADSFSILTYEAQRGASYCVEADDMLSATITRAADDSLTIEGEYAVAGTAGVDDCIVDINSGECMVRTAFGPQTVASDSQSDLESLLAAVPAPMCVEDPALACDPCLVREIDVDGVKANDFCCGSTTPGFSEAFDDLASYISALH